jgi:hypothetical protein
VLCRWLPASLGTRQPSGESDFLICSGSSCGYFLAVLIPGAHGGPNCPLQAEC